MTVHTVPTSRLSRLAFGEEGHVLRQQLFPVAAVLLIATLVLMGTTLANLRNSLEDTKTAENTMLEITTIESRLLDFDASLNAYALTGDIVHQRRMNRIRVEAYGAMDKLKRELIEKPDQMTRFNEIVTLFRAHDSKGQYLRQPEHRSEIAAATRGELRSTGMLRGKLWKILTTERKNRQTSHAKLIEDARESFWLAVAFVVLSLVAGVSLFGWRSFGVHPSPKAG